MNPTLERPRNAFFADVFDNDPYVDYEGYLHTTENTTSARITVTLVYEHPDYTPSPVPIKACVSWEHEESYGDWRSGASIDIPPEQAVALIQGMTHRKGQIYSL